MSSHLPPPSTPPSRHLSITQHNCAKSNAIFLSLFSSFKKTNPPAIVAIQEPYLYRNLPLQAPGYSLIHPPALPNKKISVCIYVLKDFENTVSFVPLFFGRTDICGIAITFPPQNTPGQIKSLNIHNIYNRQVGPSIRSVIPRIAFPTALLPTVVLGDFNIHHLAANPSRKTSYTEAALSAPYFDEAARKGYSLLNTPDSYTRIATTPNSRNSCIDLAFANASARPSILEWSNNGPASGSDHTVISIKIHPPSTRDARPVPNWALTPWDVVAPFLKEFKLPDPPAPIFLEGWFDDSLELLTSSLAEFTPKKLPCRWSKPWWTADISQLRTIFHSVARQARKGKATPQALKSAKYAYFASIKKSKAAHWNAFTANADKKSIWAAARMKSHKDTENLPSFPNTTSAEDLNAKLINHFFPPRPTLDAPQAVAWPNAPPVTSEEVSEALKKSSNTSTPGPDSIPYGTWKKVHSINEDIIPSLLSPLLQHGIHPSSLKAANGIVLPKPNKPTYSDPASFRIIVLLQTISKILERIVAMRLFEHATTHNLIHNHQCGSLRHLSVPDAALTLMQEVRTLQASKRQVSTLFLDVKGGFDNVSAPILAACLRRHHTPEYMISWIMSFLTNRTCCLLFKGSPRTHLPVVVGTPQGSPISPLLFVIYVAPLHINVPQGITISYVDDITITVSSNSAHHNIRSLQQAWTAIKDEATKLALSFSVPKTELMHWTTARQRGPPSQLSLSLDGQTILPSAVVRWLGLWFEPNFGTHHHFKKRAIKANNTLHLIRSLSPPGSGLTSANNRKLALAVILPSLLYGGGIFLPNNSSLQILNNCWNNTLRWTTNMFRTSNNGTLYPEAAAMPIVSYVDKNTLTLTRRLTHASPLRNPAAARLPQDFPHRVPFRSNQSRLLLRGVVNGPPNWNHHPLTPLTGRPQRLPIDALCARQRDKFFKTTPAPLDAPLPLLTQKIIHTSAMDLWVTKHPPPPYYQYGLSVKQHLFMNLPRFTSGRLHQMRSQSSYLAAHPAWFAPNQSKMCPRCHTGEETFDHAIFTCPARKEARGKTLPALLRRDHHLLWGNEFYLTCVRDYIRITQTGYPPSWNGWHPLSMSRSSDVLSSVSSGGV